MASTAAKTAPVATAACAITSREIASVPPASADAGMDGAETPGMLTAHLYYAQKVLCANFCTLTTLKIIQTMAVFFLYINAKGRFTLAVKKLAH